MVAFLSAKIGAPETKTFKRGIDKRSACENQEGGTLGPGGLVEVQALTFRAKPGSEARAKFDLLSAIVADFRQEFRRDY